MNAFHTLAEIAVAIAGFSLLVGATLTYARKQIESKGGGRVQLSLGLSLLYLIIVVGALTAGLGLLPGPGHAWFIVAIMLLMAHATAELGLFVIQTVLRAPD